MVVSTLLLVHCTTKEDTSYTSIRDFGAKGDSITLDTKAIQDALDHASATGGTVYIPTGTYRVGTLLWKENVSIHFETGAMLVGSTSLEDYTTEKKPLIIAERLDNVSMTGKGIIDGNGGVFWDENFKALERPEPWIILKKCRNVTLRDVKFQNSPSHTIRLENSEDVKFDGISIINPFKGPNTDGIDIVDSKNVLIANSLISTGDDAICLKSQRDTVENVVVTNCILESDDAAIKFGTGSKIATRFCSFTNTVIRRTRYGISLFMLDGGVFEHNNFSDLVIENASRHEYQYPIFIDIDKRVPDREYGIVRDNSFSNLKIVTDGKILISGHPESHIRDLSFNNITMHVKNEADFTNANKPRGNKNYPKLETSVDLSSQPAHFVLGYTKGVLLEDIRVFSDVSSERRDLFTQEVDQLDKNNFKHTSQSWK